MIIPLLNIDFALEGSPFGRTLFPRLATAMFAHGMLFGVLGLSSPISVDIGAIVFTTKAKPSYHNQLAKSSLIC